MIIVDPNYKILSNIPEADSVAKFLETCGRICYKSENNISDSSAGKFITSLIKSGHESVIEHFSVTVKFIISRATSHQLVRHRIASISQESQRYCNYSNDKFSGEVSFIRPVCFRTLNENNRSAYLVWENSMLDAEKAYMEMLRYYPAQIAREVLPNSTKTELVLTANLREWRHIFKMRMGRSADSGIRYIMNKLCEDFQNRIPHIFDDFQPMSEDFYEGKINIDKEN